VASRSDRWLRFISTLKIRANDEATGKPVIMPLRYNSEQMKVWQRIAEKIDHLKAIRLIILKSRREGISTMVESLLLTMIASLPNINALITAHEKDAAKEIFGMTKLFITASPLLSRVAIVERDIIRIGNSRLRVATAGSPQSQRGVDLTAWHSSEGAQYPFPEVMEATMQCLPQSDDIFSIGVLESTANGKVGDGQMFYEEWQRAESGESEWIPVFLAWHQFKAYRIRGGRIEQPTAEEFALRERFELSDEQLAWRRWAIKNKLKGDPDMFRQEYPSHADEAFIATGRPFFRPEQTLPFGKYIRKGRHGTVTPEGQWTQDPTGTGKRAEGWLEVWKFPEAGHSYVIGADSSMGLEEDDRGKSPSSSAGEVLDMETMEQVAEYDFRSAPHIFASHLAGIGRFYNDALLAPEVQSSGGGGGREVLVYLRERYGYWNIHQWKHPDRIARGNAVLYGWECLDPEARVLTADLQWVEARQVKVGDQLLGCHEVPRGGKGSGTPLRRQTVIDRQIFVAPKVRVTLENGQPSLVSGNHPLLTLRKSRKDVGYQWRQAADVQPGDMVKYLPVWESIRTYESGRLSAFLDGEGHFVQGKKSGFHLAVTQAAGGIYDEVLDLWRHFGYTPTIKYQRHKRRPWEQPVWVCGLSSFDASVRALGSLRPTRLLEKFAAIDLARVALRSFRSVAVRSVEDIGEGPVVGLTTDPDHTLIADGIVGHNTNAKTRPRMLARLREVVLENCAVIHSRRLLNQIENFGYNDVGRTEALSGHDDLLFAYGIALVSRSENYFSLPAPPAPSGHVDWESMGIHVIRQEGVQERLRRILSMQEYTEKGFMEL
jgi:hypothetical protein